MGSAVAKYLAPASMEDRGISRLLYACVGIDEDASNDQNQNRLKQQTHEVRVDPESGDARETHWFGWQGTGFLECGDTLSRQYHRQQNHQSRGSTKKNPEWEMHTPS